MAEDDDKEKDVEEQSEFTAIPDDGRPINKIWHNKWFRITGLGMAGLLAVIWYVAVVLKP